MAKILKYCWGLLCYYGGLFCYAFKGAREKSDSIGGVLALIAGYIKYKHPDWGPKMENPLWMSIITVFVVFFFIRLIIAPFEKHKKQEQGIFDKQKEIDDLQNSLKKLKGEAREKLKVRLLPFIPEIENLKQALTYSTGAINLIPDLATNYLIQRWLNDAKISPDNQYDYFSRYINLESERIIGRDCYVLLFVEDWIKDTQMSYFYRNARTVFKGCADTMLSETGVKFEFSLKQYSLEEALAKDDKESLDPTDIVERTRVALSNVKDYLIRKGWLKEKQQ